MPKVSVIIPIYNVEQYLPICLDSVINQTLEDIEIICINDCSTDGSLAILQNYISKDKRIKLIDIEVNTGVANARNIGLEEAKGEYIGFVDPDDYIDLNFYYELYKKAKEEDADVVKTKLIIIEQNGNRICSNLDSYIKNKSKFYFSSEFTSAIYKRSVIIDNGIRFPADLIVGEDVFFQNCIVIKSNIVSVIGDTHYYYVKRENSLNSNEYDDKRMYSTIILSERIAENYNKAMNKEISEDTYVEQYLSCMFFLMGFAITKTHKKSLKIKCAEKFIELYKKCKLQDKLDELILVKYNKIFNFIKGNNYQKMVEICIQYKNLQNYCMIDQLRKNVEKDVVSAKSISNNTHL